MGLTACCRRALGIRRRVEAWRVPISFGPAGSHHYSTAMSGRPHRGSQLGGQGMRMWNEPEVLDAEARVSAGRRASAALRFRAFLSRALARFSLRILDAFFFGGMSGRMTRLLGPVVHRGPGCLCCHGGPAAESAPGAITRIFTSSRRTSAKFPLGEKEKRNAPSYLTEVEPNKSNRVEPAIATNCEGLVTFRPR